MDIIKYLNENKLKYKIYSREFNAIFGMPLHRFWNTLTGFDIIKFNDVILCPDNISLESHVIKLYGENSSKLIKNLIGCED